MKVAKGYSKQVHINPKNVVDMLGPAIYTKEDLRSISEMVSQTVSLGQQQEARSLQLKHLI